MVSRVDQRVRVAAAKKEFGQRRVELQEQMDELLTTEQKQARSSLQEACFNIAAVLRRASEDATRYDTFNITPFKTLGETLRVHWSSRVSQAACHNFCLLFCIVVSTRVGARGDEPAVANKTAFDKVVKPFLNEYCSACHGEDEPEGDVRLNQLSFDLAESKDVETWQRVLKQLEFNQMPPEEEPQPSSSVRKQVIGWINSEMHKSGHASDLMQKM